MSRTVLRAAACAMLAASAGACATMTHGVNESFTVVSEPPNAAVTTSNGRSCPATPCSFRMSHNATFDVTVSKVGYKPYHGRVVHSMSEAGGWGMAGNVILGGAVGATVDVIDGAIMELHPNPLSVTLDPDGSTPTTYDHPDRTISRW